MSFSWNEVNQELQSLMHSREISLSDMVHWFYHNALRSGSLFALEFFSVLRSIAELPNGACGNN